MKKLFLCSLLSLVLISRTVSATTELPCPVPILTVGPTVQAPVIDGKLDESCWEKAAGAVMIPIRDKEKQTDKSRFLVCYNNNNLYIGAELYQDYLNPGLNMVSRTKVKCNNRDGALFSDDVFELFLKPPGSSDYYHLAFNMNAIVYDEKGSGFSNISTKWNCPVKVAVQKKRNKWLLELSIPVKSLNVKQPLNGQQWQINACRWNAPKKEAYAWSPTHGTFHNTNRFGKLIFSDSAPQLQTRSITTNRKIMALTVRGGGKEKIIFKNSVSNAEIPADKWKQLQVKAIPSKQTGLTWISAFANGQEIMRTPTLYIDNKVYNATASLHCADSTLSVYANTRKLASAKNTLRTTIPLTADKNAIALELVGAGAPLTGNITVNGLTIQPKQLLFSKTAATDWKTIDFNDSSWQLYKNQPLQGNVYFRYTFLKHYTLFAPQLNDNNFYIANNTAMPMRLRIGSPSSWPLKDYVFTLKLPKGITIPLYELDKRAWKRYFNHMHSTPGVNGTEYRFIYDKPVPKLKYNFGFHVLNFIIQSQLTSPIPQQLKGEFYLQGRGVVEIPTTLKLNILPEPKGVQPKKMTTIIEPGSRGKSFSNNEMLHLIPTMKKLGFNQAFIMYESPVEDKEIVHSLNQNGLLANFLCYGPNGRQITRETWDKFPNKRHVNQHRPSAKWNKTLCPLAYMEDAVTMKNLCSVYKIFNIFCDDMERGIHSTCFCKRCRKLFAEKNKLDHVPDENEIYSKYEKELIEFQVQVNKKFYDFQVKLAKQVNPDIKTSVYNGYNSKLNRKRYGIDWSLYKDIDYPIAGYLTNTESIMKTREAMGGRSMVCGYLMTSNLYKNPYANQKVKAILFHQLVNSGFGGVMLWTIQELDGRGFKAVADFTRGAGAFEQYFDEKNEISSKGLVKGIRPKAVHLYKKDGIYVMLIINTGITDQELTINLPSGISKAEILDFYNNKTFNTDKSFSTKVKAHDALIFKITPIK